MTGGEALLWEKRTPGREIGVARIKGEGRKIVPVGGLGGP